MDERELPYLADRIRQSLAVDERTHQLAIAVEPKSGRLHLTGTVSCVERRHAAERVAREAALNHVEVVNELVVEDYSAPSSAEVIQ